MPKDMLLGQQAAAMASSKIDHSPRFTGLSVTGVIPVASTDLWAEAAQIFVNGVAVQEGDLFDCSTRVLLSPSVTSGEEITVTLRLVSPSHDDGALVRCYVYESTSNARLDPGFVADELAVLQRLKTESQALQTLAVAVTEIDWSALPDRQNLSDRFSKCVPH